MFVRSTNSEDHMRNTQYIEIKDLSDWEDDATVVVHVLAGSIARVRSHIPNRQSVEMPLSDALEEADRFVSQDPNKTSVAIFLGEDAVWDNRLGSLSR